MCGIIAYLGEGATVNVLLEGLTRMEYRGYDSAGLACVSRDERKLCVEKRAGKVINLKNACKGHPELKEAGLGIAHTRWATHGPPSDRNSHPHTSNCKKLAIVHNGIIENYVQLKKQLTGLGYTFDSDTDSEVLAVLIRHEQQQNPSLNLEAAVGLALTQVRGAYGIAVIDESDPDLLVGARKGSPLILGMSEGSIVLASDATAVIGLVEQVLYLEDEDIVTCRRTFENGKDVLQYNIGTLREEHYASSDDSSSDTTGSDSEKNSMDGESVGSRRDNMKRVLCQRSAPQVTREMHKLTMDLETIEKGGYDHFMLKEIMEQPKVLKESMRTRIDPKTDQVCLSSLSDVMDRLLGARRIIIAACGTSWHSASVGEYLIESLARIPVEVEYASEFRYRDAILFPEDVVIVISQSGETADTLEAIKLAKEVGALTIGVVNVVGSSIARETDRVLYLHVGPEIGVASTKAFTGQVLALTMLALELGNKNGSISDEQFSEYGVQLQEMPDKITEMLSESNLKKIQQISSTFRYARNFLYLGRGYNFPVALEGALKLKEISYIHAEGYPAAEMKHGPIALIDEMMPVVVIAPRCDSTYEKVKSGIEEVVARNGSIISITNAGNKDLDDISEFVLHIPNASEFLSPMLSVVHLQLLSYYIAKMRGCEIDQPRNLAKSVTVE